MKASVIVPNHNRDDAILLTLEALTNQSIAMEEFEVIVIDQASRDHSLEILQNFNAPYPLHLILQDGKYGIPIARNAGAEAAQSPLAIFLDSDIIADSRLIEAHVELHEKYAQPIIGCGRLLPYPPAYRTFIEQVANPEAGLDRGVDQEDFPFYWAFGGHLSVAVQTFNRIGGFDPAFIAAGEDLDFAYRAAQQGVAVKNCPKAIGYHNHHRTLESGRARSYNFFRLTLPLLLAKHPELSGQIEGMSQFELIDWRHETLHTLRNKVTASFWSITQIRNALYGFLEWADQKRRFPRVTKFCYYRLMLGETKAGVKAGTLSKNK
jgi:GT2 family glycosyltransferase